MSFLTRTTPLARCAAARLVTQRTFATSAAYQKTATETVKDTLKTVDRAVSDKLVDGIEISQSATQKAKEAAGMSTAEAKGKASEVAGQAQGKASEYEGAAKGKASEMAGKAKGTAEEVKGKL